MKKVLYTKYNSTRKPEYQLSTSIIEEDGVKYVVKKAMQPRAKKHLLSLPEKRAVLEKIYKDMDIVSCQIKDDTVVFPFVKGESLLRDINFKEDSIDSIVEKVQIALKKTSQYKEECYSVFEMTDEFREAFGYYFDDEEIQAVCPANLDAILGNFLEQEDGKLCSIDYEWIVDFPVPVKFLDYRALFYLYLENEKYLNLRISRDEFLQKFGFQKKDRALFAAMESNFQQEVCGKGMSYVYTANYHKKVTKLAQIEKAEWTELEYDNAIRLLNIAEDKVEEQIYENRRLKRSEAATYAELEKQQAYINELKRMIKNPVYGVKSVISKKTNPTAVVEPVRVDENLIDLKAHEYRKKYACVREDSKSFYGKWIRERESMESQGEVFSYNPMISVLVEVNAEDLRAFEATVQSVGKQSYTNWELCTAVEEQTAGTVKEILERELPLEKVKVVLKGAELEAASGEYITYVTSGDLLRTSALYEVVKEINADQKLDMIYSDEDMVLEKGHYRFNPCFKPGWSPDTLLSFWYTGHMAVYRRSIAVEIGGMDASLAEGKEYDFVLRFTEKTSHVAHIDKVLYHKKKEINISADVSAEIQNRTIKRRSLAARLEPVADMNQHRVVYLLEKQPLASIVIPSKDNYDILKACIDSLVAHTKYSNYEIILVDNGSCEDNKAKYQQLCDAHKMKYIYEEMQFNFSKMCNIGAKVSNGEYLVFLNDDMEIIQEDWLERMIAHASQEHVGAVGAKLLYPNSDIIQHIGVVMYREGPAHALNRFEDKESYHYGRNRLEYNWLAVTAACMVVKTEKYKEVGGLDENLMVTFNDVDFCLKLVEAGYYNVTRNDVVLYHHESISRGDDNMNDCKCIRSLGELEVMKYAHPQFAANDPFYNKNLIQDNVGFGLDSFGFDLKKNEVNNINQIKEMPSVQEDILCSVDTIEERDDKIYIHGWSMIPGCLENNDKEWTVLLQGQTISYEVDTDKTCRLDVSEAYPNELLNEFIGFKCVVDKQSLEAGEYQLGIAGVDGCKMVEETIKIA